MKKAANKFRKENNHSGGVVVFFKGEIQGWINELRDPQNWQPGCIAIKENGDEFIATGGAKYGGAEKWIAKTELKTNIKATQRTLAIKPNYSAWRISYQSSEQAAKSAYTEMIKLFNEANELADKLNEARLANTTNWLPMETSPKDNTPVLLKLKCNLSRYNASDAWAGLVFVGKNRGDTMDWSFSAPVGQGGFPDDWFLGWQPLPKTKG